MIRKHFTLVGHIFLLFSRIKKDHSMVVVLCVLQNWKYVVGSKVPKLCCRFNTIPFCGLANDLTDLANTLHNTYYIAKHILKNIQQKIHFLIETRIRLFTIDSFKYSYIQHPRKHEYCKSKQTNLYEIWLKIL